MFSFAANGPYKDPKPNAWADTLRGEGNPQTNRSQSAAPRPSFDARPYPALKKSASIDGSKHQGEATPINRAPFVATQSQKEEHQRAQREALRRERTQCFMTVLGVDGNESSLPVVGEQRLQKTVPFPSSEEPANFFSDDELSRPEVESTADDNGSSPRFSKLRSRVHVNPFLSRESTNHYASKHNRTIGRDIDRAGGEDIVETTTHRRDGAGEERLVSEKTRKKSYFDPLTGEREDVTVTTRKTESSVERIVKRSVPLRKDNAACVPAEEEATASVKEELLRIVTIKTRKIVTTTRRTHRHNGDAEETVDVDDLVKTVEEEYEVDGNLVSNKRQQSSDLEVRPPSPIPHHHDVSADDLSDEGLASAPKRTRAPPRQRIDVARSFANSSKTTWWSNTRQSACGQCKGFVLTQSVAVFTSPHSRALLYCFVEFTLRRAGGPKASSRASRL